MLQPGQQLVFVAGRVAAEIARFDAGRQGGKSHPGARQRRLLRRHVAIPKLVGQHQVGLGPHRHHRLITPAPLIVAQGRFLVTLDNRGVLIHRGDPQGLPLFAVELGGPLHHSGLDGLQALDRLAAGDDEGFLLLARGAAQFQFLIVEAVEKGPHGAGLGQLVAQPALEALVVRQQLDVLEAIAAHGLEQDERLDVLGLVAAAPALLEVEVGGHQAGNPQGAEGAGGGQEAGMGAGHLVQWTRVNHERRFVLSRYARRHELI